MDINTIDFEEIKLGKSGRNINLFYNKEPINFCTSMMYTPFGVKSVMSTWSDYDSFSLDCSISNPSNETSKTFKEFIDKLDVHIQKIVKENISLFDKKNENASDDFTYHGILKQNKDYQPLMKTQITRDTNGNFTSFVFDKDSKSIKIDQDNIKNILNTTILFKSIIKCAKVWYFTTAENEHKVGSVWEITQLKICGERTFAPKITTTTNVSTLMITDDD